MFSGNMHSEFWTRLSLHSQTKRPGTVLWYETSHAPAQRLQPHGLLGFSFAPIQIPNRAWGFWNSISWHVPNPEWGHKLGNQPFLLLLNRPGLGF